MQDIKMIHVRNILDDEKVYHRSMDYAVRFGGDLKFFTKDALEDLYKQIMKKNK